MVVAIAAVVMVMATSVELASNGPLSRLPVSDVNVEPVRVFKELQAQCPRHLHAAAGVRCRPRYCPGVRRLSNHLSWAS